MSCTVSEILALAKSQMGVTEYPAGSNTVKYNTEYYGRAVSGTSYPWCCVFIWWLFKECGAKELFYGGNKTASCTALMNYAKKNGLWVTGGFKAGDLILYNFNSDSSAEHIGLCESASGDRVTCIEGNTGTASADNGGAVMCRSRSVSSVLGAYRPRYKSPSRVTSSAYTDAEKSGNSVSVQLPVLKKGSRGRTVKALQILLNGYGHSCGKADGDFGTKTLAGVKSFQKSAGIAVDGSVGRVTWTKLLSQ
ncbi:MAG: peptidoglycan-binding protein [Oscillospiraceae bacterium]|nr:peptidoglycan-binding protein [Oscillospiraceae bacterium]